MLDDLPGQPHYQGSVPPKEGFVHYLWPPCRGVLSAVLSLPLLVLVSGCGLFGSDSGKARVRAELVRLPGQSATAPSEAAAGVASAGPAAGITSDVSVSSLRIPVTLVELRGPGGAGVGLYSCTPGADGDCLVELNGPALQNLITTTEVAVPPGTYNEVVIGYCAGGGATTWNALMAAEARFAGMSYFTRTAGGLEDTGPAEPTSLPIHGCGSGFPIKPPLALTDTTQQTIVLRLYFDIRDIAYAAAGDAFFHFFQCSKVVNPATTPFVCTAYPTIVALYDGLLPIVERYRINGSSTIGLQFEASSGTFVEAYVRRYFTPGVSWNPGFTPDAFFKDFTPNGDGSYRMMRSDVTFPAFRRETHSGTMQTTAGPVAYTAVRLP